MTKRTLLVCICLLWPATVIAAQDLADPTAEAARKIQQTYEKSIISLAAVLKFEAKGVEGVGISDQERKAQCLAMIIDPSGLAITALTNLSPQRAMTRIRIRSQTLEIDSQVEEVKYRLADGTELPARLLLKDEDLDLAFLAPQKPLDEETRAKIAVIPLAEDAAAPQPLDTVVVLSRGGDDLDYVPMLHLTRISTLLDKPRTIYISDGGMLGTPAFNLQGQLLGIFCRCQKAESPESENVIRVQRAGGQAILPTADIRRLLPQAMEEMSKAADGEKKAAEDEQKE